MKNLGKLLLPIAVSIALLIPSAKADFVYTGGDYQYALHQTDGRNTPKERTLDTIDFYNPDFPNATKIAVPHHKTPEQQSPLANYSLNRFYHKVQAGETLEGISLKYYGEGFKAMAFDIGKRNDVLYFKRAGTRISVTPGNISDALYFEREKPMSDIKPGDILAIGNFIPQRVQEGETYATLAKKLGITETEARERFSWNGNELKPGSVYYIPKDTSQKESTIDSKTKGEIPLSTNSNNSCGIVCH